MCVPGVLLIRILVFLGSILGSTYLGKLPVQGIRVTFLVIKTHFGAQDVKLNIDADIRVL